MFNSFVGTKINNLKIYDFNSTNPSSESHNLESSILENIQNMRICRGKKEHDITGDELLRTFFLSSIFSIVLENFPHSITKLFVHHPFSVEHYMVQCSQIIPFNSLNILPLPFAGFYVLFSLSLTHRYTGD